MSVVENLALVVVVTTVLGVAWSEVSFRAAQAAARRTGGPRTADSPLPVVPRQAERTRRPRMAGATLR